MISEEITLLTKGQITYDFTYEVPRVVTFIKAKSRMVVIRDWKEGVMGASV
jgi:hypothetical protein